MVQDFKPLSKEQLSIIRSVRDKVVAGTSCLFEHILSAMIIANSGYFSQDDYNFLLMALADEKEAFIRMLDTCIELNPEEFIDVEDDDDETPSCSNLPKLIGDDIMQSLVFLQSNMASDKATMAEYLMALSILKDYGIFTTEEFITKMTQVGEKKALIHFITVAFVMNELQKNKN
jgi:hypothetical protein